MVALGYATLKDDPVEAEKYKTMMSNIMSGNTEVDDHLPELPVLTDGAGSNTTARTNV